uniref:Transmembrane protein 243 n=1 Tax=Arion vulgaris TaxID=1028688 RepID=A0A0B7C4K7_9EUPU
MIHQEPDPLLQHIIASRPTSTDRVINLVVGTLTSVLVLVTLIMSFAFGDWPPDAVNIYFAFVILFVCVSLIILIYWYRQGELDPKFKRMIFYNAFTIALLCVAGNLYISGVGKSCNS